MAFSANLGDTAAGLDGAHLAAEVARIGRDRISLSTMPASVAERRLATSMVALATLAFAVAVPFARVRLTEVPAFIPAYEAALLLCDLVTALLLFGQFVQLRTRALFSCWPAAICSTR